MSASNWDTCPRCRLRAEKKRAALHRKAGRAYGKVSAAKYLKLCEEASRPVPEAQCLREDWELGVQADGLFFVLYRCECQHCGFAHEFKHEQKLALDKTNDSPEEE